MHQRFPLRIERLPIPGQIRRLWVIVKGQIPLELHILISSCSRRRRCTADCVSSVLLGVNIIRILPRVDLLQHLHSLLVYLVPHHVRSLQADLRPVRGHRSGVRRLGVVDQSFILVKDANLLGFIDPTVTLKVAAPRPGQVVARRCRGGARVARRSGRGTFWRWENVKVI